MRNRTKSLDVVENRYFPVEQRTELRKVLEATSIALCERSFKYPALPLWFTDHGPRHSDALLQFSLQMAREVDDQLGSLTPLEAIALVSACYLHDLGMAHLSAGEDAAAGITAEIINEVRQYHVKAVHKLLPKYKHEMAPLYEVDPRLEAVLPWLCAAHGTQQHAEASIQLRQVSPNGFRGELLGKILLLADELDLGEHRSLVKRFPDISKLPAVALGHHYKHHYTTSVELIGCRCVIRFSFPKQSDEESRLFPDWIGQKLNAQVKMVCEGLSTTKADTLRLSISFQRESAPITREVCPPAALNYVRRLIHDSRVAPVFDTKARPNQYLEDVPKVIDPKSLADALEDLMDSFYRECTTKAGLKRFEQVYVRTVHNDWVMERLLKSLAEHASGGYFLEKEPRPARVPFVLVGGTGVGKSSFVRRLFHDQRIVSWLNKQAPALRLVLVDCINIQSVVELVRAMLRNLLEAIETRDPKLYSSLKRRIPGVKLGRVMSLSLEDSKDTLRAVLEVLHMPSRLRKNVEHNHHPTCFVMDNLDRVASFDVKEQAVLYLMGECVDGIPMVIMPIRWTTKRQIEMTSGHFGSIPTREVFPPSPSEILAARTGAAFEAVRSADATGPWGIRPVSRRLCFRAIS